MIYLDTHVVVWLYAGLVRKLSQIAKNLIRRNDLLISPMVRLELSFLYEIGKIKASPQTVLAELETSIGLQEAKRDFRDVIRHARHLSWTRDPVDRIITAYAALDERMLLTSDREIRQHYKNARW